MKIEITQLPRWNIFKYFLLGFYKLQEQEKIKFKFKANLFVNLTAKTNNMFMIRVLRKIYFKCFPKSDLYNLKGNIILDNGEKKKFVIDSADAPYLFDSDDLEECDIYFKMQCPKDLNEKGFELVPDLVMPWTDHKKEPNKNVRKPCNNFEKNKYKIRPLMIGTRKLADGISYERLQNGFDNYIKSRNIEKNKKLMCYFGDSKGPKPVKVGEENFDIDQEKEILGRYGDLLQHPNEKRAKVADIIKKLEPKEQYDSRVINVGNSDTGKTATNENLIIPIEDFCNHIAGFQYNLNISGYKLSIPNRFIESFISGTGIVTDKLSVKWYQPFGKEVFETVPMGYLKDKDVDWNKFEEDINNLPEISKEEVIKSFEEKYSPLAICKYMIDELANC